MTVRLFSCIPLRKQKSKKKKKGYFQTFDSMFLISWNFIFKISLRFNPYRFYLMSLLRVCVLRRVSCVRLSATHWTIAHQAPLSTGFTRQEYWNGLPCPPPGDLLNPGIKPTSLKSPALAAEFFTTSTNWEAHVTLRHE